MGRLTALGSCDGGTQSLIDEEGLVMVIQIVIARHKVPVEFFYQRVFSKGLDEQSQNMVLSFRR
jgi:hypothetical protein